jgi:alkanesulfonate monooxygenase SsuD/methylene tetrahydromethanopterin reductase-like flavin-dependent oxidoreductase (luciferase family)
VPSNVSRSGLRGIGIFDHMDRAAGTLADFFARRLELVELYDRLGFYSYHVAEHHSTPLGMAPSPNIFLATAAGRTQRLRLGPLVYLLPLYHPLRLLEEICMLDQLSGGRLDVGIGRGISPIEARLYGTDPTVSPKVFNEVLEVLLAGFGATMLNHKGEFFTYEEVPIEFQPFQQPHPPLWYGASSPDGATRSAGRGFNILSLAPVDDAVGIIKAYYDAATPERPSQLAGIVRFVVVADTDREAVRIAEGAYGGWYENFNALYRRYGRGPVLGEQPKTFDAVVESGKGIAGSPETVRKELQRQVTLTGVNYLVCQFAFGTAAQTDVVRSIELFAEHVMPELCQTSTKKAAR